MQKRANIYDICDRVILQEDPAGEPGQNLRTLYRKSMAHPMLKYIVLKACRHPDIPGSEVPKYQNMMRAAMRAGYDDWRNPDWIDTTFRPIADLLDKIENPQWQQRRPLPRVTRMPSQEAVAAGIRRTLEDILRIWRRDKDPYFPVAAQIVLTGHDQMSGANFLNILRGLGSFESQNITMLFNFARCFLMSNPQKRRLIRTPYAGICEPMSPYKGLIWHRTAYYDTIFFQILLTLVEKLPLDSRTHAEVLGIMESLVRFIVIHSQEWLVTPNKGISHPAVTCLPKGDSGVTLCRLSPKNWAKKRALGFGDYVPDTDTTFLSLSVAKRWIDFTAQTAWEADPQLLEACRRFLQHPFVEIINEYQVGSGYTANLPTIKVIPIDDHGAIPIWFDKPFEKQGRTVRDMLGNEICPGHNMDILESILVNRAQWQSLEGENLATTHRLLDFHHRLYLSDGFKKESSFEYYLPEIYMYYTGRVYDTYLGLDPAERERFDPDGKIPEIRRRAIDYCRDELLGFTLNAFDASLAVSALVLLRYDSPNDGVIATGLQVILDALGEGRRGHPFKAYEWNRVSHPTRIIVGSDVSTSFFVMNALVMAHDFLFIK